MKFCLDTGVHFTGQIDKLIMEYRIIFRYMVFVTLFVSLATWLANPSFILIWVGQELFIDKTVFALIMITMSVMLFNSFTGLIIHASGDFRLLPHMAAFEVIVFIVLSYLLFNHYGVVGFFTGFIAATFIGLSYSIYLVCKILKSNIILWINKDYIRLLFVVASIFVVDFLVKSTIETVLLQVLVFTTALVPVFYYFTSRYVNIKLLLKGRLG